MALTFTITLNLIWIILAYLIGSINFSILLTANSKDKENIKNVGSKNAGATNAMRVYGWKFGLLVFILDTSKAFWFATILGLLQTYVPIFENIIPQLATLFVIIGHIFPLLYNFKGGKGAATLLGMIASISLILAAIGALLFFIVVFSTKYVSLGSIVIPYILVILSVINPFLNGWYDSAIHYGPYWISTLTLLIGTIIVTLTHRSNIKRLLNKTENKLNFSFIEKQKQKYVMTK